MGIGRAGKTTLSKMIKDKYNSYNLIHSDALKWAMIRAKDEDMVNQCITYDTEESWTYGLSKDYLLEHAQDWYNCNEMLKIECPKYGIKYIDTSKDREKVLNEILENLFK